MKKITIPVIVILLSAATMLMAFEVPRKAMEFWKKGSPRQQLSELSVEKEMAVHRAKRNIFDKSEKVKKELKTKHKELKEILLADKIDENKFNKKQKEINTKKKKLHTIRFDEIKKLAEKLDKDELKKVIPLLGKGPRGFMKHGNRMNGKALHKLPYKKEMTVHKTLRSITDEVKDKKEEIKEAHEKLWEMKDSDSFDLDTMKDHFEKVGELKEEIQKVRNEKLIEMLKDFNKEERKVAVRALFSKKDGRRGYGKEHKGKCPKGNGNKKKGRN